MTPLRRIPGRWYWANRRDFVKPGLYVWTGKNNLRVIPVPRSAAR